MIRRNHLLAIVVLGVGLIALTPSAAHAADADYISDSTYRLLPDEGVVQVEQNITLVNNKANTRSGNVITSYFYSEVTTLIPVQAVDVSASVAGSDVTVGLEAGSTEDTMLARISTGANVTFGQRRTMNLVYRLPTTGPRSKGYIRIGKAFSIFPIWADGDPGLSTVRVVVPERYTVGLLKDLGTWETRDGQRILEVTGIENPDEFHSLVTAQDDIALTPRTVAVGSHIITVKSWPEDTAWSDFVAESIQKGIPELEALIGTPWPESDRFEINETFTPYLLGYAGWYLPLSDRIEIGDELDTNVIFHELAHAWFNRELFSQRWINEGFAEELASQVSRKVAALLNDPEPAASVKGGGYMLGEWDKPTGTAEESRDYEHYGYNTSFTVMRALADEIGPEKTRAVISAAINHEATYQGEGETEQLFGGFTDWRRLLDLAEVAGGSRRFEEHLVASVLSLSERGKLPDRTAARADYTKLQSISGSWAPPKPVRNALDAWDFARAQASMAIATKVLETRDTLTARAASLGVSIPKTYEDTYEGDGADFAATNRKAAALDAALTVLERTTKATALDRGSFATAGLWGYKPEVDLAAAKAAFDAEDLAGSAAKAERAMFELNNAEPLGKQRIGGLAGASVGFLALLVGLINWRRRRRKRRRAAVSAVATSDEPPHDARPQHPDDTEWIDSLPVGAPSTEP